MGKIWWKKKEKNPVLIKKIERQREKSEEGGKGPKKSKR